ncbi:MAG: N-acetyltransferase [Thermodesulfobacteriota bacterium]
MIRKAKIDDVQVIYDLLNYYAEKGLLLGRSFSTLYEQLRDFQVYVEVIDESEVILGVCALHIWWHNLAEICSLAVREDVNSRGIGTELANTCLKEARQMGINRVFTLTYAPAFFSKLQFKPIDRDQLPHKIWRDCINCPKFPDCKEEPMIWGE